MALNSELARLGVTGALRVAPVGTAAPTGMDTWTDGWIDLGYISDDGITESVDEDTEDFTPWQSSTPIRTEITRSTKTFSLTLWETSAATVSLYYRVPEADMSTSADGVVEFTEGGKPARDLRSFGIDVIDGTYHRRIILPQAEVTERGDITYKSDTMIGYEITISAYPDRNGVAVRRSFSEGWSPSGDGEGDTGGAEGEA